jgi:hypothetical protein
MVSAATRVRSAVTTLCACATSAALALSHRTAIAPTCTSSAEVARTARWTPRNISTRSANGSSSLNPHTAAAAAAAAAAATTAAGSTRMRLLLCCW